MDDRDSDISTTLSNDSFTQQEPNLRFSSQSSFETGPIEEETKEGDPKDTDDSTTTDDYGENLDLHDLFCDEVLPPSPPKVPASPKVAYLSKKRQRSSFRIGSTGSVKATKKKRTDF